MQVEIRLLGGFAVVVGGVPVPDGAWRRRQASALVKLLALQPGRRMLRDRVIDALWPDLSLDTGARRLHKAAHYARTALGGGDAVVLGGELVTLLPAAEVVVDVDVFDRTADAALAPGAGPDELEAAISCFHGTLLPDDLYEPWAEEHRETRRLRYLELLRRAGRWEELATADPADEGAHVQAVRSLLAAGDRRGALLRFDRMVKALDEELGIGPSPAALALRDEIESTPVDLTVVDQPVARRATPIPAPTTRTIGREADIEAVAALLDGARVVTLLGPGGVGKTRIACEVALRRSELLGVETCFVDLTLVDAPEDVAALVVQELGVHKGNQVDSDRLLQEALRGRTLLLVLDNFEHVIEAAGVVTRIVQWSTGVQVLATSRARLQVSGEHVFDVAPLRVDDSRADAGPADRQDAVALFAQAARAVDPTFELRDNLPDVAAICRSLDGLPLAIELAAGHVRTLTPMLLRTRLAVRLGSPTGSARDVPARQLTVPATIDWSLQLLGAEERRLFARLGVFAAAVPLEAVEEVCGDEDGDVVGALSRLVDQSLVRRVDGTAEPRFAMLSLLRQRARELLAGQESGATARRHAFYFARLLEEIDERRWRQEAARWIDLIAEMLPDIRAAHAWAVDNDEAELAGRITAYLGTYWHRDGYHVEGRSWVARALRDVDRLSPAVAARVHLAAGFLDWGAHDLVAAHEHWSTAAERFRALGSDRYLSYALGLDSGARVGDRERYEAAIAQCDEAIALARRLGEEPLLAQALNIKGELARVQGDDELARHVYEEGLGLARAAGDEAHASMFLANLSYLADHRGEHAEARRLACEAARISWSQGRRMLTAWVVAEAAGPELGLGRPERGAYVLGAGDAALATLGVQRHPGDVIEYERVVDGLRAALGDAGFEHWRDRGAELSLGEAVAFVLTDDRPPGATSP